MLIETMSLLRRSVRVVPDWPKAGIQFLDLMPLLSNADLFADLIGSLSMLVENKTWLKTTKVVAPESRGFIVGASLAAHWGSGFVPVRKPGKLPGNVHTEDYVLEYGQDRLEIQKEALSEDDEILIVDDVLATGGTALATIKLCQRSGAKILGFLSVLEIAKLNGRKPLEDCGVKVVSALVF